MAYNSRVGRNYRVNPRLCRLPQLGPSLKLVSATFELELGFPAAGSGHSSTIAFCLVVTSFFLNKHAIANPSKKNKLQKWATRFK